MARIKTAYRCAQCQWESPKWLGQCRQCEAWGTLEEYVPVPVATGKGAPMISSGSGMGAVAVALDQVRVEDADARPSGMGEFDRVLGGGIVPGSVVLLAGEPGVGKSTLLLDVAARYARAATASGLGPVLYVTGEESVAQVSKRAHRIGALESNLLLAAEGDVGSVASLVQTHSPSMLIVDSVQTMTSSLAEGSPGSVSQVKAVSQVVINAAKANALPTLLVGHVTKDGTIAGPRTLEHLVDVVCQFEGERTGSLRLLRTVKNRYGSTDEVGCFTLVDSGIREVSDPSKLFTSGSRGEAPGSFVTVTLEGNRPLLTEIQALVAPGSGGSPRRTTSGLESSRVAMIMAVVQAHLRLDLSQKEVYVSTVGGAKIVEPAVDLAIALAIWSAARGKRPSGHIVALGEVGLTGEVRGGTGLSRRVSEAARLGWDTAIVPAGQISEIRAPRGVRLFPVDSLGEAVRHAFS
ncbi:DNA repair protein RadA [Actinomyces minihominis]|uniref:DNA repair protein RadA n=1 Tax=Actinomyces minihominis TaxID=2002838 RepID=UPI000C074B11|nr:DNA repair protein RadA [Actinomyces minihominis]